jgi:two-component system response regulator (stage 0 sporulation protein F)
MPTSKPFLARLPGGILPAKGGITKPKGVWFELLFGVAWGPMGLFSRLGNMKMLLVDDDEWIRDSLTLLFEGEGCHFKALETAEEAMQELNRQSCDIIICDYKLPGMDGLEFFGRVKESHPQVMKVLVTAYGDSDIVSQAASLGIDDFIQKPFTSEAIKESLEFLVDKRRKNHSRVGAEAKGQ